MGAYLREFSTRVPSRHVRVLALLGCALAACGQEPAASGSEPGTADGGSPPETKGAEQFFMEAIAAEEEVFLSEELMPRFDELEPVAIEAMIGTWKGGKFDGGEPDPINWWGKQVLSEDEALGFLCERPDGSIYSWELLGRASMGEREFRGVASAALVYDNGFMTDYFRRVSDDVVVGYSPLGYGEYEDLFFHLTRVDDFEVE